MTRPLVRTLASLAAVLLTVSCFGPLFSPGGGWVGPVIAAALVATACGSLGRALPLSGVTGTVLVVLGGFGLLTAVGTPDLAHLGFIPSGRSLTALHTLISNGFSDIRSYAPPVVASPGLVVVAAGGVYAVAVVVDLFAVGADRPALAGIPLLGLVAVPAAFRPHGLGIIHLLLALLGWLVLLALEGRDRLVRWGRPLGRTGVSNAPLLLGGAAGRVAGVGLVIAFGLPALIPDLHGGIIHPPSTCCAGGSVHVVPPLVTVSDQLHQSQPSNLLTLTTDRPQNLQYLRFTALDDFDDGSFTLAQSDAAPGQVDGPLNSATPGLGSDISTIDVTDTINVFPTLAERYLPLPYSPVDVRVSGNWKLTEGVRTVFSTTDTTAGQDFGVDSVVPDPTKDQLRRIKAGYDPTATSPALAQQLKADLVTSSIPPAASQLASRLTRTGATAYDNLMTLQTYFTDPKYGFKYTLTPTPALPRGSAAISAFLKYKQGFCQQYATVFTLMARSLGLPARVAVGFTPGKQQSDGSYLVQSTDAHAWPEVWFTGVGWVRFEPTPRGDLGSFTPSYLSPKAAGNATSAAQPTSVATPSSTASFAPPIAPKKKIPEDPAASRASGTLHAAGSGVTYLVLVIVVIILLLLAVPALLRLALRRRRERAARAASGPDGAHLMWAELLDTAVDIGWVFSDSETPRATGRRLAGLLLGNPEPGDVDLVSSDAPTGGLALLERPEVVGTAPHVEVAMSDTIDEALLALGRITQAEERARYAPPTTSSPDGPRLVDDVRQVRAALLVSASGSARLRARILPGSLLASMRSTVSRTGSGLGRASTAVKAPLRALGRRRYRD